MVCKLLILLGNPWGMYIDRGAVQDVSDGLWFSGMPVVDTGEELASFCSTRTKSPEWRTNCLNCTPS
jgi:hypothetical protein